ncbi:two pore domain potassium channel family protein [Dactylosporangium aurantiacum]|uniref:Two pore domain potassium channel family protein n=1 Tax=Dactylosporangium aurantiacum TaxID=35754 RepID=A0A9Q9IGX1_9ACTN|nr:potassium channel family protein [Dactylosporangium aurantiacum]MDG6100548.1 potassium channel family protein [Dactylosporangium aurantiacum]UWZ55356.1 two pore domain potassium channel family protein [Dactylosporangium aurantiacum]
MRGPVPRALVTVVAGGVGYYLVPLRVVSAAADWLQAGVAVVAFGVLVASFRRQLRRQLHGEGTPEMRLETLLHLLIVTVLGFSLGYVVLAGHEGQFAGLTTRTDALYFTLTTLATVGYGDVHPVGQAARITVSGQILFNLIYVGAAVAMIGGAVQRRLAPDRVTQHVDRNP